MAEEVASWLLEKGTGILSDDEVTFDVLIDAIRYGDLSIVTLLIGNISDSLKMKFKGRPLLSVAVFSGHGSIVKHLVSKGADIEGIDDYGQTPLHVACRNGHLEIVKFLFSQGGDINRQTFDGMTPFAMATTRGQVEVLKYLISKEVEIERSNNKGWTPLIWACFKGHLSTANYLLHVGADVDGHTKVGWTALHYSIHFNRLDFIKSLVSAGADLNWPDKDGNTPLHIACFNGRIQILKYLLSIGADLQKAETNGTTPLHYASSAGHQNVVSFILQQKEGGELVNRPNARGETPLHVATSHGFTSVIDILVSGGGELNAQTNEGRTCLHLAANFSQGSTDVEVTKQPKKLMAGNSKDALGPAKYLMAHLISKGADVNIADKAEKYPVYYLTHKMDNLVVSQELTESHALGEQQRGGASNDVDDRGGNKVLPKTHPGDGAPSPTGSSSAISDEVVLCLSEEIPNGKVLTLGLKLGISRVKVSRFESKNVKGTEVTSDGTRAMLYSWLDGTTGAEVTRTLRRALNESGLIRLSEKYL